ncbi:MAG: flagellar export protein FliJ [Betaproteobacteria bacterium]
MNQVRSCWGVLLNKAQEEVTRVQCELQQLRERMQSLQASAQRLQQLHQDYLRPPQPGEVSTGMLETLNRRQFADQLLVLIDRVERDKAQVEQVIAQARARLLTAERERMKMQALVDQDAQQVKASKQQREQRQLDELGTLRYNLGGSV